MCAAARIQFLEQRLTQLAPSDEVTPQHQQKHTTQIHIAALDNILFTQIDQQLSAENLGKLRRAAD